MMRPICGLNSPFNALSNHVVVLPAMVLCSHIAIALQRGIIKKESLL